MQTHTLKVSKEELLKLNKLYKDHIVEINNPHIIFGALHNKVQIVAYHTGSVLLRGREIFEELIMIKKYLGKVDYSAIGSDEVGTGDLFGPVVVCSCYVSKEDVLILEKLGVRDSKNMTDEQIINLAPRLAKRLTHTLLIVNPSKYNELTNKNYNLNKIKALLHNQAITKTFAKVPEKVPVILDQFCLPSNYFNYLKDEVMVHNDIHFYTKAESQHVSVAAASMIARYAFLVKMEEYSKKLGVKLLKGAGTVVDDQLKFIYDNFGIDKVKLITKMNFKNVAKVLDDSL